MPSSEVYILLHQSRQGSGRDPLHQSLAISDLWLGVIQNLSQYFCTKSVAVVYANSRVALDLQSVQLQALGEGISWGPAGLWSGRVREGLTGHVGDISQPLFTLACPHQRCISFFINLVRAPDEIHCIKVLPYLTFGGSHPKLVSVFLHQECRRCCLCQ